MAIQVYCKTFSANMGYHEYIEDARKRAMEKVNEFFLKHDGYDIVNIVEKWDSGRYCIYLTVYYKDYI